MLIISVSIRINKFKLLQKRNPFIFTKDNHGYGGACNIRILKYLTLKLKCNICIHIFVTSPLRILLHVLYTNHYSNSAHVNIYQICLVLLTSYTFSIPCLVEYPIRKTCPCNVYPLEPHFYIAKLGYAGVYLFFLFLLQNIDCGYSLERIPTIYVLSKNKKNID